MYKVRYYMDNNYEVYEERWDAWHEEFDVYSHFVGSIADCEAWIRLKEGGRL